MVQRSDNGEMDRQQKGYERLVHHLKRRNRMQENACCGQSGQRDSERPRDPGHAGSPASDHGHRCRGGKQQAEWVNLEQVHVGVRSRVIGEQPEQGEDHTKEPCGHTPEQNCESQADTGQPAGSSGVRE
jgi:hypothetical protein